MKKIIFTVMAVLCASVLCLNAFAATEFVPSVEGVPSVEIVKTTVDDKQVTAVIKDASGTVVSTAGPDDSSEYQFALTSLLNIEKAKTEDIKTGLRGAEAQLRSTKIADLPSVKEDIAKAAKEYYGDKEFDDSKLVAADLFDLTLISKSTGEAYHLTNGQSVEFTLKSVLNPKSFCVVLHNINGTTWKVENVERTTDGLLKLSVDSLSPFALAVPGEDTVAPSTGEQSSNALYIALAAAAACGIIAVVVLMRKKSKA